MSLTITTSQTYPNPPQSLIPLSASLKQKGINACFSPWQETPENGAILPLAAWDYAMFYQDFCAYLKANAARFVNSAALMLWNSHKSYLCDLAKLGVAVIPTQICAANEQAILQALAQTNWQEIVLKPAVGQSGNGVVKFCKGAPLPDLTPYAAEVVLQPFIAEVAKVGETSLIFFEGQFSHAICRQPPANEWRANSQYQVAIIPVEVAPNIIETAQKVLQSLPQMPVYARVDGTIIEGEFLLNELELIEPALYLDKAVHATERFATVLAARLKEKA